MHEFLKNSSFVSTVTLCEWHMNDNSENLYLSELSEAK